MATRLPKNELWGIPVVRNFFRTARTFGGMAGFRQLRFASRRRGPDGLSLGALRAAAGRSEGERKGALRRLGVPRRAGSTSRTPRAAEPPSLASPREEPVGASTPVHQQHGPWRRQGAEGRGVSFLTRREAQSRAPAVRRRVWPVGVAAVAIAVLSGGWLLLGPSAPAKLSFHRAGIPVASAPPAARGTPPPAGPPPSSAKAAATAGPIDPARFGPGACVAFPPTTGDRHLTVFLDPGHGGPDPGALGGTQSGRVVDEAELTLPTVLDAVPLLQQRGYQVVVSRTADSGVARAGPGDLSNGAYTVQGALNDWTARAVCANLARAAVLVSVHFNAGSSPLNAGMLTAYDDLRSFSAQNLRLASLLHADVLASMNGKGWGIPDGGVKTDGSVGAPALDAAGRAYGRLVILGPAAPGYLLTPSDMPGAVIEPLFLTDPFEGSIAASAEGQQAMAAGIAEAVDTFLTASR